MPSDSISKSEKQHVNICSSNPLTCDVRVSESGYHKATFSTTPTFGSRSHPLSMCVSVQVSVSATFTVPRVGSTLLPHGRVGYKQLFDPRARHQACIGRGVSYTLGLPSSWQPVCQAISCSPETSQEDNPPNRGRPVRRIWPRPAVLPSTVGRVIEV